MNVMSLVINCLDFFFFGGGGGDVGTHIIDYIFLAGELDIASSRLFSDRIAADGTLF